MLAQIHLVDEVKRVGEERVLVQQRLKRLGQVYLDGLLLIDEYRRQKQLLEDKLSALVVPGVDAAREAGKLLEDLPGLCKQGVRSSNSLNGTHLSRALLASSLSPASLRQESSIRPVPTDSQDGRSLWDVSL